MQVALVTGGSIGFGREVARALAADGWAVVLDGRRAALVEAAVAELCESGATVVGIAGDVADPSHRAALLEAVERFGGLDLVVANASTLGPTPLPSISVYPLDGLEEAFRVNVVAPVALVQAALPALRARRGTVVAITSDAAVEGYPGWGGYGMTKAALEQAANVLAAEEPAVAVYRFDPGDMRTEMHQAAFPGEDISDRPEPATVVPAFLALLRDRPASGRYRAADLLATPAAVGS
jgi:NAD(P)-dependent dehydrogenase (short-subunit alcohol dehydrogenase family)